MTHRCPTYHYVKRQAPWHVREAQLLFLGDRIAWETARNDWCRGHLGGTDERDFRTENPAPVFKTYLKAINARQRALREGAAS